MNHAPIEFTDKIVVKLQDHMGDDSYIVSAARVDPELGDEWKDVKDDALLEMMMRDRHGTPFEQAALRFYVEAPIFVSREHFRHRIGVSYNEWSSRYKRVGSATNPFRAYIPPLKDFRTQIGTPGNYEFGPLDSYTALAATTEMTDVYTRAYQNYTRMLDSGVAKEVARNVLPLATMTKYIWTCNPRSLMAFLELRMAPNALLEIQEVARKADQSLEKWFPRTHKLFHQYGRIAP